MKDSRKQLLSQSSEENSQLVNLTFFENYKFRVNYTLNFFNFSEFKR